MFTRLKQYLYPPVFEDEQKTSVAQLLHRIFLIGFITVSGLLVSLLFSSGNPFFRVAVVFVAFLIVFTAFIFLHRGQVTRSSEILLYGLLALLAITLYLDGGFASPGFETLIILIFFAGFLLGQRKMLLYALFVVILIVGVFLLEQFNLLPAPISEPSPLINLVTQTANLVVVTSFAYYVFRQLQTALARTQQNQDALAQRNTQLQREIEDRKQVEGAYARSNAILQAVFEAVPDGILAVDQDGMFVAVNKRFRQMWGVPDHIHRSQPARNYVYEKLSDPTTFNQIIEESYLFPEQERKHLIELRDGSIFESFSHPQVVAGESIGRVWTYRDITALKQTEAALRTSEQQFRQLFELAPIGMAITDLNGRFLQVNAAFCRTVGYTAAELSQLDFPKLTHPDDISGNLQLTQQLIQNSIPSYELEKRYIRKNGSSVDVFLQVSVQRAGDGSPQQLVAQVVDLSNLHQAEEALRQAQKLESLGMMSSGIAHDFNNLLTVMLAQASLAEAKLPTNSPIMRHIQRVLDAAKRASTLTQQLLTYSGQSEGESQPLSLNNIIEESLRLLEVAISKNVLLETSLAPKLPPINGDESQLQQVVMNLVINAAEAMNGNAGNIQIFTQLEQIQANADVRSYTGKRLAAGRYVRLEVSDNGEGMDRAILKKVFDPFFTTKRSGHGLGLATVLGIVRGHQGGLRVTSKKGDGTTFQIYFPVSHGETAVSDPNSTDANAPILTPIGGTVLVVDDEEHVREAVVDVLNVAGIEVLTAVDGLDGLRCYREKRDEIQMILLDVVMPNMNGTDMLKRLRQLDAIIPVVLSSGYSQPEAVVEALRHPNTHFLRKPYRWDQLVEVVRPLIESNS